jgi:hypothetical protein
MIEQLHAAIMALPTCELLEELAIGLSNRAASDTNAGNFTSAAYLSDMSRFASDLLVEMEQ